MNANPEFLPGSSPLGHTSRRSFLKTSGAAAFGGLLATGLAVPVKSQAASGDTLRLGLIGCGGRGTGAAGQPLAADKNAVLTAMADVFEQQLVLFVARRQRVIAPEVETGPGNSEQPAGHRDVKSVVGEFLDQPESYFGSTFSFAK